MGANWLSETDLQLTSIHQGSWMDTQANLITYIGYKLLKVNSDNVCAVGKLSEAMASVDENDDITLTFQTPDVTILFFNIMFNNINLN